MAARLKRDVGRCSIGTRSGHLQGMHFGMCFARQTMPPFPNHLSVTDNHTADTGIW